MCLSEIGHVCWHDAICVGVKVERRLGRDRQVEVNKLVLYCRM